LDERAQEKQHRLPCITMVNGPAGPIVYTRDVLDGRPTFFSAWRSNCKSRLRRTAVIPLTTAARSAGRGGGKECVWVGSAVARVRRWWSSPEAESSARTSDGGGWVGRWALAPKPEQLQVNSNGGDEWVGTTPRTGGSAAAQNAAGTRDTAQAQAAHRSSMSDTNFQPTHIPPPPLTSQPLLLRVTASARAN
jgi:hypothetical protein